MDEYIKKSKVLALLIGLRSYANSDDGHYRKSGIPLYRRLCEVESEIKRMNPVDATNYCKNCGAKIGGIEK